MQMFYITAIKYESTPSVLCQDVTIETSGYYGADLDRAFEFANREEVNGFYAGNIVMLTSEQVEKVKEIIHPDYQGKESVYGCSADRWKRTFMYMQNVEFKEVEIKF